MLLMSQVAPRRRSLARSDEIASADELNVDRRASATRGRFDFFVRDESGRGERDKEREPFQISSTCCCCSCYCVVGFNKV